MNEIDILLAKDIPIVIGQKTYTFKHPNLEWWLEFAGAIGGAFSAINSKSFMTSFMAGKKLDKNTEKALNLFCSTINTSPKQLKKDLTIHQALALVDKWLDCIGVEEAKRFFGQLGDKLNAMAPEKTTP
jgi:hypothetical protein